MVGRRALLAVVLACAGVCCGGPGGPPPALASPSCPWVGQRATVATRVSEVIAAMSTADKLDLVGGSGGVGGLGGDYTGETTAVPSLCIPSLGLEDGPAGVGDSLTGVTQLPAPVALAASWSPSLAAQYGSLVGAEDRTKGVDIDLGPTVNIVRDPRWGRAFEAYGEDPYLTGAIGDAYIDGVQSQGVLAQVKHLDAYDEETGRDSTLLSDSVVSERALQEIYLPPFADAVTRAHVSSVMCSYNEVNGIPACQSGYLMTQVLDDEFAFPGFVTSDWFATQSAAPSVDAGLDMQMPDACYLSTGLQEGLASGAIPASTLDEMDRRILTELFRFGLIGRGATGSVGATATSAAHQRSAASLAAAGTVLLKNAGGVLPLAAQGGGTIAVIGSDASSGALTGGGGSASVVPSSVVTPLAGITAAAGPGTNVTYNDGSNVSSAAAAASAARVAVVFASLSESESEDLPNIELGGDQDALISAVAAANPHTIVVLNTGSAVAMPWLSSVAGVLEAWYPGQEDGTAIASVLFGRTDPGGKLPVTFPASLSQVSDDASWPSPGTQNFSEGIFVGYRWFEKTGQTPLFPFGYGLSYTRFRISHGVVARTTRTGDLLVRVRVANVGHRTGADVVQLYVGDPAAAGEPARQLKGFDRVVLRPGHRTTITFRLIPQDLSAWTGRWTARAGRYALYVGDSSALSGLPVRLSTRLLRTVVSGRAVGPAPSIGADSPLLAAQCPEDALAPDVNALETVGLAGAANLADLP